MKRTGKWYRKNEAETMKMLGLKPTPNSGSGWLAKEDGQNDKIICQLKSTDKSQMTIHLLDIAKLENNALIEHKLPVFAIQFIGKDLYLLVKPCDIPTVNKYLKTGIVEQQEELIVDYQNTQSVKTIKSSEKARLSFNRKRERDFEKRKEERKRQCRKLK